MKTLVTEDIKYIVDELVDALLEHRGFDKWWTEISPDTDDRVRQQLMEVIARCLEELEEENEPDLRY